MLARGRGRCRRQRPTETQKEQLADNTPTVNSICHPLPSLPAPRSLTTANQAYLAHARCLEMSLMNDGVADLQVGLVASRCLATCGALHYEARAGFLSGSTSYNSAARLLTGGSL